MHGAFSQADGQILCDCRVMGTSMRVITVIYDQVKLRVADGVEAHHPMTTRSCMGSPKQRRTTAQGGREGVLEGPQELGASKLIRECWKGPVS